MKLNPFPTIALHSGALLLVAALSAKASIASFTIGDSDFLLDGKPQ